jgi:23S rRNA pseudouridine1911/1915/1917 synthase
MQELRFLISTTNDGTLDPSSIRLDQFLSSKLPDLSRSRIQRLIEDGFVKIDDSPAKSGQKLKPGQVILVGLPDAKPLELIPEDLPIKILFEDEWLAVVEKPAGMVTHPGAGVESGTLVHALMHHMKGSLSGIGGVLRPGIVHRLDKDTSGLLIIAKNDVSHRHLSSQIQTKEARRTYLAVVEGLPPAQHGVIEGPIGRDPKNRLKMTIIENGKAAKTSYRVLKASNRFALLQVDLATGRTHQIRVHVSSVGCPVVGDLLYNQRATGTVAARKKFGLIGHALHAARLRFKHPADGRLLELHSSLPADLSKLTSKLLGDAEIVLSEEL